MTMTMKHRLVTLCCVFACVCASHGVHAADTEEIQPTRAAAFTETVRDAQASSAPVELGEPSAARAPDASPRPASSSAATPSARRTVAATTPTKAQGPAPKSVAISASPQTSIEHVTFNRRPVRIALPVDRERLITFPSAVALHAPAGHEGTLRLEIIGRTVYATALAPFGSMRVIAEDIENGGVQIPMDFVADGTTAVASEELEVHLPSTRATGSGGAVSGASAPSTANDSADMVTLTRHAARTLYAPRRLVPVDASIRQIAVATHPVAGLYRGARVQTMPVGAWRSGDLYLTAVRITNQEKTALELQLDELRGQWIAATSQHGRLGPAGDETDTSVLYLVCDRPFEACC